MSGKPSTATPSATLLVAEIVDRYGSVGEFCSQLRYDLDDPTVELPRIPALTPSDDPLTAGPPLPARPGTGADPHATMEPDPGPGGVAPVEPPSTRDQDDPEARTLRGLWRRLRAWF